MSRNTFTHINAYKKTNSGIAFLLFLLIFRSAFSQTSYSHTQLQSAFLTPNVTPIPAYSVPVINATGQMLRVEKRYLKAKLDMGDIYTLGLVKTWNITLGVKFTARTASNALIKEYTASFTTTQSQPERTVFMDITSISGTVDHFDVSITQYANPLTQLYAQNVTRFTLSTQEDLAYSVLQANGITQVVPTVVKAIADPLPASGQEVSKVKFLWDVGANVNFNSYDLEILKVEPNASAPHEVIFDWTRAEKIEVENGQKEYAMTLSHGTGYYFWRVRPVGNYYPGGRSEARNLGSWSSSPQDSIYTGAALYTFDANNNPITTAVSTINASPTGITSNYFYYLQFNNGINWSYNKVLTEGARQAETITYANGLNQVNQVQSKSFSSDQVIATQTVQDYSGRPALNSLPAPVNSSSLGYKPDFFKNNSGARYSAGDFDIDNPATTTVNEIYTPSTLGTGVGTPNDYYSDNNTIGNKKDFVPNANGFPYTRTLFYNDPTGRVFKQSAPGATMKLIKDPTGTHNITTLYGSVAQDELDYMFGSEAPIDTTTYKVTSIDPNHVNTVSYMSKNGQVLATCLSDALTPTNLDKTGDENPTPTIIYDHFPKGVITPGDNVSRTSKLITVDKITDVTLYYTLSPAQFGVTCSTVCYTCDYKVEISVICPQEPNEPSKNVTLTFFVPPVQLVNCINTQSPIVLNNLAPINLAQVSGPGTSVPLNMISILPTPGVDSKVKLDIGSYIFEKRVYVNNNDPLTGKPYLDARVQELRNKRAGWTQANNCNCNVNVDDSGFDCTPAPPVCTDPALIAGLFKFVKSEQESMVTTGGSTVSYKSKLTGLPASGAPLSNGYYNSASPTDMTSFTALINDMMGAPFHLSCSEIEDCFNVYGNVMLSNVGAGASNFDTHMDLLQKVFDCLGYNTAHNLGAAQYTTVIPYGQTGANTPGNIRTWYKGLSGLTAAPASVSGVLDIEVLDPNGTNSPVGPMATVISQNNCVNMYKYPNALTAGLGLNAAGEQAWLAQHVYTCINPPAYTGPTPSGMPSTSTAVNASLVSSCIAGCQTKRLSFEQALNNEVYSINLQNGVGSPGQSGWQSFNDLFNTMDKPCVLDLMVAQCDSQCHLSHSQNISLSQMTSTSPYTVGGTTYSSYAAYISSPAYQAAVKQEQLEYEQAMTWNSETKPLGTYTQAGDLSDVKGEIEDFISRSYPTLLNKKSYDGTLASAPSGFPVSLQATPFAGNANYVFNRDQHAFTLFSSTGTGVQGTAVANVIWDKSNLRLLEINFAIYCSSSSSPLVKWSYAPTYPCVYFQGFGNQSIYLLDNVVKLFIDKTGQFHAVLQNGICAGVESKSNVSSTGAIATMQYTVTSTPGVTNIALEVGPVGDRVYLYPNAVNVQSTTVQTATDIVTAINSAITIPDYTASNLNASGVPTNIITIFINGTVPYDPLNLKLYVNENVTTVVAQKTSTSLSTLLNTCGTVSVGTGVCPYGFMKLDDNRPPAGVYVDTPSDRTRLINDLLNFFPSAMESIIMHKTPSPIKYNSGCNWAQNYPPYIGAQSVYTFTFGGCALEAYVSLVWAPTGEIYGFDVGIAFPCRNIFAYCFQVTTGILKGFSDPTSPVVTAGNFLNQAITFSYDAANDIMSLTPQGTGGAWPNGITVPINALCFGGSPGGIFSQITNLQSYYCCPLMECKTCFAWKKPATPDFINEAPAHQLTCDELKNNFVADQVGGQLDACLDQRINDLKATYRSSCLNKITDNFYISQEFNQHHYTLYYYDRAKNLTKTVPPAGVEILTSSDIAAVQNHRKNPGSYPTEVIPAHRLVTKYTHNSIKQLVKQETPDGGITQFWYNANGQLVLSQDAQQAAENTFSYTRYDNLSRIIETGLMSDFSPVFTESTRQVINELWTSSDFPANVSGATFSEVTHTQYSTPDAMLYAMGITQNNLRNRISKIWKDQDNDGNAESSRSYSYDPHGNVEWLSQELPGIGRKTIRYEYDLVSNNVKKVFYNENTPEQFIHKYTYDADNRITETYTSKDGLIWDKEVKYDYYLHGPLARTEIGEDQLQGVDYTYTIDGYLKSINQAELTTANDPGKDNDANNNFLKDEFAMELGYYTGDYNRSGSHIGNANSVNDPYQTGTMTAALNDLYNGNVSYWMSNIRDGATTNALNPLGLKMNIYRYDKLNRIKRADFRKYNAGWAETDTSYDERFTYDGNGNIKKLIRNGYGANIVMDKLNYEYKLNGTKLLDNRLYHVTENAPLSPYTDDIESQGTFNATASTINQLNNYRYDAEGKLIKDITEGVEITWNILNKVASIRKSDNTYSPAEPYDILFEYDAAGNKIVKRVKYVNTNGTLPGGGTVDLRLNNDATYYVRDVSGNIMAVYHKSFDGTTTTYTLKEMPIYGSSRIGEYNPDLVVLTASGYVEDGSGAATTSDPSALTKWLVPTSSGVRTIDFGLAVPAVGVLPSPGNTGTVTNTAIKLNNSNGIMLGAYTFNSTTPQWRLIGSSLTTITTGTLVLNASQGENRSPVFIKNPASPTQYYFIYPSAGSGFTNFKSVLLNTGLGNGSLVANSSQTLVPSYTFAHKLVDLAYSDGNSRIITYTKSADDQNYLLVSMDVTPSGIQTPVVRASISMQGATPVEVNDIAISPNGMKLAMTLYNASGTATSNDIVVFEMDPSCMILSNPVYYKSGSGKAKHLCFTAGSRYLYYSGDLGNLPTDIGRINMLSGAKENVLTTGSHTVDLQRTSAGGIAVNPNSAFSKLVLITNPEFYDATQIHIDGAGISVGPFLADGLPQQTLKLNMNLGGSQLVKYTEFNNWIVGAKTSGGVSGVVDIAFTPTTATVSNVDPIISSAYHNVAVAENVGGTVDMKFFVAEETGTPYLMTENNSLISSSVVQQINADASTKSIFVKVPGDNPNYYLVTGKAGQLYYHLIEYNAGTYTVQLPNINKVLKKNGGTDLLYTYGSNFGLAVYNDLRSGYTNKLYSGVSTVAADGTKHAILYEHQVTETGISEGVNKGEWTATSMGVAEIGEIHISPLYNELTVSMTEQEPNIIIFNPSGLIPGLIVRSIGFTSQSNGVAVGSNGAMLRTTNEGVTWSQQTAVTSNTLNQVFFATPTTGYVVGNNATLLKTTNGGTAWTTSQPGVTTNLNAVYFTDADKGLVVGDQGLILKTINGGASWIRVESPTNQNLNSVFAVDAQIAYAVGNNGTILKTIDGGNSWSARPSTVTDQLKTVQFVNSNAGYILASNNTILKTINAGATWDIIRTLPSAPPVNNLYFAPDGTGYAVGNQGLFMSTTNGTAGWTSQASGVVNNLNTVFFTTAGKGFVGADNGLVLSTLPSTLTGLKIFNPPVYVNYTTAFISKLKRMGTPAVSELVQALNDERLESELRRGRNSTLYLNQLLPPVSGPVLGGTLGGVTLGGLGGTLSGTLGGVTGTIGNLSTGTLGGIIGGFSTGLSLPQNHRHSFKVYNLDPVTTQLTYSKEKLIGFETINQSYNAVALNKVLTFDYTPAGQYLYFVQREAGTVNVAGSSSRSRLLTYSSTENATVATVVSSTLNLNSGVSNFGLPLLPVRIYQLCTLVEVNLYATRELNKRLYELNDHLGNVRVSLKDYREWTDANLNNTVEKGENSTVLNTWSDYYAFGSRMPGRTRNLMTGESNGTGYRFGFNGMEQDFRIHNSDGQIYNYNARMYDARLGRWMSTDPDEHKYSSWSSYSSFFNAPTMVIDPNGKGGKVSLGVGSDGKPALIVSATIYVYSEVESINNDINKYANDVKTNIRAGWANGAFSSTLGFDEKKSYPVEFHVEVIGVSKQRAKELASKNGRDDVNFVHLNNSENYSQTVDNVGSWSINSNAFGHEFGHLLGNRFNQLTGKPSANGTSDHPRTSSGAVADPCSIFDNSSNTADDKDFKSLNFGLGIGSIQREHSIYGVRSSFSHDSKGKVYKFIGEHQMNKVFDTSTQASSDINTEVQKHTAADNNQH